VHLPSIHSDLSCVQATRVAFCALLRSGTVVCWGAPLFGGTTPHAPLCGPVKALQATRSAFAALVEGGEVMCWGAPEEGGDSSGVQEHLWLGDSFIISSFIFI